MYVLGFDYEDQHSNFKEIRKQISFLYSPMSFDSSEQLVCKIF